MFKKYLAKGKTGYVANQWCSIEEAIQTIQAAGGLAVLAPLQIPTQVKVVKPPCAALC